MAIVTAGRTDLEDFFKLSGVISSSKLNHTPFLVFETVDDNIVVIIVTSVKELLRNDMVGFRFLDDTPVMCQWRGQWRSDYFRFTVGDVRKYMAEQV